MVISRFGPSIPASAAVPEDRNVHEESSSVRDKARDASEPLRRSEETLAIDPDDAKALYDRGNALFALKRIEEALASYDRAVAVKPDYAEAFNNRGNALVKLERVAEALASYDRALAFKPAYPDALNNRGNLLKDFGRIEEALASYDHALTINPDHPQTLSNRGNALSELNRLDEAIDSYTGAIALSPTYAEALTGRAMASLLLGDFASGWRDYEHRYEREDAPVRALIAPFPVWRGESVKGKSIVVYEEQGLGDIIHFCRYLNLLSGSGAEVTFLVRQSLQRLLRASFPDVRIVDQLRPKQDFDFQSALMSLPGAFEAAPDTTPADVPYLTPESVLVAKWRQRVGEQGTKVGIAWQGHAARIVDLGRSFPLRCFEPLAAIPGVRLISLQKNEGLAQIADLRGAFAVEAFAGAMDTGSDAFVDTAAIMANLDLVITPDTSIAHLAGALGRPVWLALKHVPDWRWMLGRTDTPWYPTMTLYRQSARGDWPGVFARMALDLAKIASRSTGGQRVQLQIPISVGELFDKITILEIKAARIADPTKLRNVTHELELLREVEGRLPVSGKEEERLVGELRHVNEMLWDVEDMIRACEARQDFGAEFVALARSVYRHNDRRAELKKLLSALHGSELVEEKSYASRGA
jgi:tetratricopeptide (TPR) repeat protein